MLLTTYLEKQKTSSPDGDLVVIHQWQKVNSHQTNNLQVKEKNNFLYYLFHYAELSGRAGCLYIYI